MSGNYRRLNELGLPAGPEAAALEERRLLRPQEPAKVLIPGGIWRPVHNMELLVPAGDRDSLRAGVANGADAVYLGLDSFNARRFAENFGHEHLPDIVDFCHGNGVKVHVTANTLVKNSEIEDYFDMIGAVGASGADAVIVQDPCLIPLIRKCAPKCAVHMSTQATVANVYAIPEGADRVILPRELGLEQIRAMASRIPVEVFGHGALCLSYSGQCLFSSIAGGRSGNRGRCAQPCRRMYNGTYPLSTSDLCLIERIPEIAATGAVALKIEGRMRGPVYTGVVTRIYRKYLDMHRAGGDFSVEERDIGELMMAFNRDFTTGFAFNGSIVDPDMPMNRGIFLGVMNQGKLTLESSLRTGDGVMALGDRGRSGNVVNRILLDGREAERAERGDTVEIHVKGARNGARIYKTSSADLTVDLGREFEPKSRPVRPRELRLPRIQAKNPEGSPKLFVRTRSIEAAASADKSGADVVYYSVFADDAAEAKAAVKNAKFFLSAPGIMCDSDVEQALSTIEHVKPDGVLAGERGLASELVRRRYSGGMHLDMSFNVFNDISLDSCPGIPIISPELNFAELRDFRSKRFIAMVHGPLVLMTTKEPLGDPVLEDESGRRFRTRKIHGATEILNCTDLGLFSKARQYLDAGIRWFCIDPAGETGKTVRIYRTILSGGEFDDRKIRRGHTTGHFSRGVD